MRWTVEPPEFARYVDDVDVVAAHPLYLVTVHLRPKRLRAYVVCAAETGAAEFIFDTRPLADGAGPDDVEDVIWPDGERWEGRRFVALRVTVQANLDGVSATGQDKYSSSAVFASGEMTREVVPCG